MKKTFVLLFTVMFFSFSHAQQPGRQERYKKVALTLNAKKNGYKIIREGDAVYIKAIKVEDPLTKKLLEGLIELQYKCRKDDPTIITQLSFTTGNSTSVAVSCPILIEPKVLIYVEEF